jgi:hypothetical protein
VEEERQKQGYEGIRDGIMRNGNKTSKSKQKQESISEISHCKHVEMVG